MAVADLDFALITKRKRMMDSVGHYARPELLTLRVNARPAGPMEWVTPGRQASGGPGPEGDRVADVAVDLVGVAAG